MKLRQFQYVVEVVRNGMNITAAADKLFTSQPGVSSQIKRLEDQLGIIIFERSGKHINGLTAEGVLLVERFEVILNEVDNIKRIADDFSDPKSGALSIAATHTQACYVLPEIITEFRRRYPKIQLQIYQGSAEQIAELTANGEADIGISADAFDSIDNLVLLPCYRWDHCVMVQQGHPLASEKILTHSMIAKYPIITYVLDVADRSVIKQAFKQHKLDLNVVLTAADAQVIKTYVRSGLGVGICAKMSYDEIQDVDLVAIDASHLFGSSVTNLAIRKNSVLREYAYNFIQLLSSHLEKEVVNKALSRSHDNSFQKRFYAEYESKVELR